MNNQAQAKKEDSTQNAEDRLLDDNLSVLSARIKKNNESLNAIIVAAGSRAEEIMQEVVKSNSELNQLYQDLDRAEERAIDHLDKIAFEEAEELAK